MYVNGVLRGTSANSTDFPTTALIQFVLSNANYGQLNDSYNLAALWKTRLTNAQLELLTGDSFYTYDEMAIALNYNIQ
jgi:hypothetical protein